MKALGEKAEQTREKNEKISDDLKKKDYDFCNLLLCNFILHNCVSPQLNVHSLIIFFLVILCYFWISNLQLVLNNCFQSFLILRLGNLISSFVRISLGKSLYLNYKLFL